MFPVAFTVGSFPVYAYSLALFAAFTVGYLLVRHLLSLWDLPARRAVELLATAAMGGIVGARALYVFTHWSSYVSDPWAALRVQESGLVFYGGVAGGAVTPVHPTQLLDAAYDLLLFVVLLGLVGLWRTLRREVPA